MQRVHQDPRQEKSASALFDLLKVIGVEDRFLPTFSLSRLRPT
jgi:hypothetical protein